MKKIKYVSQPSNFKYSIRDYITVIMSMRAMSNWRNQQTIDIRNEFENSFANYLGVKYAISVCSGNIALDLAVECLDLNENDEVISASINFYGTHLAILRKTTNLILCETNPETLNINVIDLQKKITNKTKAIFITHMNGSCCNVEEIKEICKKIKQKIFIVEDVARSLGSSFNNKKAGTFGDISIFSFQQKKNLSTLGEGGMIATNNMVFNERIRKIRSFGFQEVWGTNLRMTRIQCAVGITQLKKIDLNNNKRKKVAKQRNKMLKLSQFDIKLPIYDAKCNAIYTYYTIILGDSFTRQDRDKIRTILLEKYGVETCVANEPTYITHNYIKEKLPKNTKISYVLGGKIINLPIHFKMSKSDNKYIVRSFKKAIEEIKNKRDEI